MVRLMKKMGKTFYQALNIHGAMDKIGPTCVGVDKIVSTTDLNINIETDLSPLSPYYILTSETNTKNLSSLSIYLTGNTDGLVSQTIEKVLAPYDGVFTI